ncbi:MAG: AEC family transporter [Hyphomonas sp.]
MSGFLAALLPIVFVVALGRYIGWRGWITPEGWRSIERLAYVILLPALVIRALATTGFSDAPWLLAGALVIGQLALFALGFLARFWPGLPRPAVGSIIQSNSRWNTFVALSLGESLFGAEGLALVTLAAAAMIPAANVLAVYGLVAHADSTGKPRQRPIAALARNPIIIACIIGIGLALLNIPLPPLADETLRILAQAAIALGLLSAGAGINISALKLAGVPTVFWALARLLLLPIISVGSAMAFGLTGMSLFIVLICASTPTAISGYILSRELGGDAPLSANLIALQTLLATLTMPLLWFVLMQFAQA